MVSLMSKLVPSPIRKLGFHIGRRGMFLLFWAFLWLSSGYRWFLETIPVNNYRLMIRMAPASQWGILFMVMAVVMALGAMWKLLDPLAFAVSAWLSSFLCAVAVIGAFSLPGDSAFTAGSIAFTYFLYALLVYVTSGWPEAISQKKPKRDDGD